MVRSVSVTEPEWSSDDRTFLIASQMVEREVGSHGIPMSEAMDIANQFNFEGHLRTDWVEKKRLDTLDAKRKENPDANFNGVFVSVSKKR